MGFITMLKKNKWMIKLILNTKFKDKKKIIAGFKNASQFYAVENTQTNMKELIKCALCPNMCRFECPYLRITKKEMYAPATKARITYHMERGQLAMDVLHNAEVAYMCTNCDGCKTWCPMDISTGDLLRGVRADLVKNNIFIPFIKEFNDRVLKNKTTFDEDLFSKHSDLDIVDENAEVFYFCGCVMAEKKPEAVKANIEILKHAKIRFTTNMKERQCCGGPLYTLGFDESVKKFAQYNLALFKKSGAKIIISDCPACVNTFQNTYPKLGFKHKLTIMTTAQFYKKLIKEGKLIPKKNVNISITYHDPCITIRKLEKKPHIDTGNLDMEKRYLKNSQELDSARFIFSKIPGLKLKEPFLHGNQTQCCGRGGVSHIHHPQISDAIGKQRVEQLKKTGVDTFVSSCPACEEGLTANGAGKCLDIAEILVKSLE
ncbi:MAG: (Fe-S)-binding protein [Promethearchaeota archaeon]